MSEGPTTAELIGERDAAVLLAANLYDACALAEFWLTAIIQGSGIPTAQLTAQMGKLAPAMQARLRGVKLPPPHQGDIGHFSLADSITQVRAAVGITPLGEKVVVPPAPPKEPN